MTSGVVAGFLEHLRKEKLAQRALKLGAHDYLEGECARSGLLKTYRLDRIQKVLAR